MTQGPLTSNRTLGGASRGQRLFVLQLKAQLAAMQIDQDAETTRRRLLLRSWFMNTERKLPTWSQSSF